MSVDHPFLARHANIVFALKTFAAAMLALAIALWLDLPRPYWAMATVYITSQPFAGATSSKAFYRVLGTVLGASVTVAMVPNLVNAPELLCLSIALWVGLCLYLSLLDVTPRSYVFMLAGYTVAFIGFPVVSDPARIFDMALARVEEISLGIVLRQLTVYRRVSTRRRPCRCRARRQLAVRRTAAQPGRAHRTRYRTGVAGSAAAHCRRRRRAIWPTTERSTSTPHAGCVPSICIC